MAATGKRVLLCGYYGEHNLGDDALLEVALRQLPPAVVPIVTAHDQIQVRERFGVATVPRRSLKAVLKAVAQVDALVLGGGSLLQDSTSFRSLLYYAALILAARCQGKPVMLWGQGLGPLKRRRSQGLVRALLLLLQSSSWRDPASAALAQRLGGQGLVAPDPVWALAGQPWRGRGGPIVVCFRPTHQLVGEAWRPYLHCLDQLAAAADRPVIWLAFHGEQDAGLLQRLRDGGLVPPGLDARSREVRPLLPREALAVFSSAGLVIAMRLHGLILAALAGSPTVALSYDPKVEAAAEAIGTPCQSLDQLPDQLKAQPLEEAALLASWQRTLDQPPPSRVIQALQAQAEQHRQVFACLQS
jgi:polysaccharide pyruvyl transferase CsaB